MKKELIIFGAIVMLIGIIMVSAQTTPRISPRCNSNGIIEVDYAYKVHTNEGYTNYISVFKAGDCEREFRGNIRRTTNVDSFIITDIRNQVNLRNLTFYPDPFGEIEVDGRGFFTIP